MVDLKANPHPNNGARIENDKQLQHNKLNIPLNTNIGKYQSSTYHQTQAGPDAKVTNWISAGSGVRVQIVDHHHQRGQGHGHGGRRKVPDAVVFQVLGLRRLEFEQFLGHADR